LSGVASEGGRGRLGLLALALVLTGFNLRLAVASVPPLLSELERQPGMSSTVAGLLTSLPFLCFAVLAFAAPPLTRRFGAEAVLVIVLTAIGAGTVVRAAGSTAALFAGTVIAAAGIAVGNALVPAAIKAWFPARVGVLIGLYTAVLSVGAALAGGLAVPAKRLLGWQGALAIWAVPAALTVVTVLVAARARHEGAVRGGSGEMRTLLRDRLAWQVTLFFGIQAAIVFSGLSWLPSILRADGYSPATAGVLLALYALGGVPASLALPVLASRIRDQRRLAIGTAALEAVALAGLAALPSAAPAWVALFALGQGASFSLALTLIALRSPDARRSTELSGMAQAIGYAVAALGPFAVGALHTATSSWTAPLLFLLVLCAPMAAAGAGAGRNLHVTPDHEVETGPCR
jgi:CP family cyanate transporter-like MFS transporter